MRGWCGPRRFPLCKENQESTTRIFIAYPYVQNVMHLISEKLNSIDNWNHDSLEECFRTWLQDRTISLYAGLPSIMIKNIWWERNNVVFKDKTVSPDVTLMLSLRQDEEFKTKP